MKGVSFVAKLKKDSQNCYVIIFKHSFTLLFAFCILSLKKRLLKFDQELSACWKKRYSLRYQLYQRTARVFSFTNKILENLFGSGRCGSESCLQIYRFHIPGNYTSTLLQPSKIFKKSLNLAVIYC